MLGLSAHPSDFSQSMGDVIQVYSNSQGAEKMNPAGEGSDRSSWCPGHRGGLLQLKKFRPQSLGLPDPLVLFPLESCFCFCFYAPVCSQVTGVFSLLWYWLEVSCWLSFTDETSLSSLQHIPSQKVRSLCLYAFLNLHRYSCFVRIWNDVTLGTFGFAWFQNTYRLLIRNV